eukprot:3875930-Pyramimonas_sp.AAC.3
MAAMASSSRGAVQQRELSDDSAVTSVASINKQAPLPVMCVTTTASPLTVTLHCPCHPPNQPCQPLCQERVV